VCGIGSVAEGSPVVHESGQEEGHGQLDR
jgi:hypothetical protein